MTMLPLSNKTSPDFPSIGLGTVHPVTGHRSTCKCSDCKEERDFQYIIEQRKKWDKAYQTLKKAWQKKQDFTPVCRRNGYLIFFDGIVAIDNVGYVVSKEEIIGEVTYITKIGLKCGRNWYAHDTVEAITAALTEGLGFRS
jgi:hypothetical protein